MDISVYITSYNQKGYLKEAVDSVLAQTCKPSQVIIVDDASTDGSQDLISSYCSRYGKLFTVILHERNLGVTRSRINALEAVTGDYATFLDGDDRFLPTKLEKESRLLFGNPRAQIAFSNVRDIDENGSEIGTWAEQDKPPEGDVFWHVFARAFPKGRLFRSEMVNYHAWARIGFHDTKVPDLYEDYEMRIRLTKRLRTLYCPEILSEYRLHPGGLSRARLDGHVQALHYIYRKNAPLLKDLHALDMNNAVQEIEKLIAQLARRGLAQCIEDGDRVGAFRLFLLAKTYDPDYFRWAQLFRLLLISISPGCSVKNRKAQP